jgi:hypothetical protein
MHTSMTKEIDKLIIMFDIVSKLIYYIKYKVKLIDK